MDTRVSLWRAIDIVLVAALVALLSTVSVGASAAEEPFARGSIALAIECDVDLFEGEDPFASVDSEDTPCPDLNASTLESVQFTGNVAWATVAIGDGTELRVYLKRGGVWERIPYEPAPAWEYDYMIEQENLSLGIADRALLPVAGSSDITWSNDTWAVQGEAYEEYYAELEDLGAGVEPAAPPTVRRADLSASIDAVSDDEFAYMIEQENHALGIEAAGATARIAAEVDDPDFLYMIEQENLAMGTVGFTPETVAARTDVGAGVSDDDFAYMIEQENLALGIEAAPATARVAAEVSDPDFLYMIEQENLGLAR